MKTCKLCVKKENCEPLSDVLEVLRKHEKRINLFSCESMFHCVLYIACKESEYIENVKEG